MKERSPAQRFISDLVFNAIIGVIAVLLLNYLCSLIFSPTYWGSGDWWWMASAGAIGGMASAVYTHFQAARKSKTSK